MKDKQGLRLKRHQRIKLRMFGTKERPRLVVNRSLKNLFAQIIDDTENKILFSLTTLNKEIRHELPQAGNVKAAAIFGEIFAQKAKEKGITKIIFDRGGYLYHGRVQAFTEALRKAGLEF